MLSGVLPRLYPPRLQRAYAQQDAGVPVYIITAASQEMADLLAHVLAFDGGLGTRSEIVDGRYTGRPAGPFNYREGKVLAMRELAEREAISLEASYAYSDSESDLPMLRAVRHAVVVNPDAALRRIAREEGWEVIELDRLGRRLKVRCRDRRRGTRSRCRSGERCASAALAARRRRAERCARSDTVRPADRPRRRRAARSATGCTSALMPPVAATQRRARSASSSPSPASTATIAAPRSSRGRCAMREWR